MDIYRTPILTAREVARHLEMPETTLDRWIRTQAADAPLVHAVVPEKRGWPRMPFVSVIEAYVLRALRKQGFKLDEIQQAAEVVRREFDDPYALASQRIATDGVALFVQMADRNYMRSDTGDLAIEQVLADFLKYVSWDDRGMPTTLRLKQYRGAEVIIDPRFGWGAPVLGESKVPVEAVADLWKAGETIATVAEEFGLTYEVAEDVLRAAPAA